ncbi:MAG: GNAT family N-acetyltransferase [Hydrococcus sp. Prado102]|jgi:ribosomal protein S18 acetylase RimI-like enzyme|nr:GNAT family N-acetyltransferase [Hydrococcus sp. Prado102]
MGHDLPNGYQLRMGSHKDRILLTQFMRLTYQELFPDRQDFAHLAQTVESYLSSDTPLWWVEFTEPTPVACLWMGNAIDLIGGDRYAYIFLLYVALEHRRRGIAKALMQQAQMWAIARGDRQIGLQVFSHNQIALDFYRSLGYETQAFSIGKSI